MSAAPGKGRPTRLWIAAALAILVIGLGARLALLSQEALWADEQYTLNTAGEGSLARVLEASQAQDPHPPLYFLLLHLWIGLAGDGDVAIRLPSVLAGALSVGLVLMIGMRLWPARPWRALAASLLAALSPFLIYYSQEARSYSTLVALELLAIWAVLAAWEEGRGSGPRRWGPAMIGATAALAAMATHHYGFLVGIWAGLALLALLILRRREGPWPEAAGLGLLALGTVPSLVRALGDLDRGHGLDWLPDRLVAADLLEVLAAQVCGPIHAVAPRPLALASTGVVSVVAAASVVGMAWRARGRRNAGELLLLLALALLFAAPVAYSLLVTPILWYGNRYLIVAAPLLILTLLAGMEIRPLRPVVVLAVVLHLACAGFYLHDHYRYRQKRLWDVAAAAIDDGAGAEDVVSVIPGRLAPLLDRYMERDLTFVEDSELMTGGGPARAWLLATGDLRGEILSRTPYRIADLRVLRDRGPGALYLHLLVTTPGR